MEQEKKDKTILSNFDTVNAAIELLYCYSFKKPLNHEKLEKSINQVVSIIPEINGVLKKEIIQGSPTTGMSIKHSKDEIKIRFKEIDNKATEESIMSCGKPEGEFKKISLKKGAILHSLVDHIKVTGSLALPMIYDEKVLAITHLYLKNLDISVLSVSINHSICDAAAFSYFMDTWGKIYGGKLDEVNDLKVDRTIFKAKKDEKFMNKVLKKEDLVKIGRAYPFSGADMWTFNKLFTPFNVYFSKKRIEEMKKVVIDETGTKKRISTHDVISAHYMKMLSYIRDDLNTKNYPFVCHINFRKKFKDCEEYYFGNGVTTLGFDITRREIMSSSFATLALKVRDLVDSLEEKDIQNVINYHYENKFPLPTVPYNFTYGTIANDWRILERKLPQFGDSECLRWFSPAKVALPNSFFLMNDPNGGVNVMSTFETVIFGRTKRLDLTNFNIYEKLRSMYCKIIQVHKDVFEKYELLKKKKRRFVTFSISGNEIVFKDEGNMDSTIEDLRKTLPDNDGRFIYYYYDYTTKDGPRSKIVYIYWIPDNMTTREKFVYVRNHAVLKKDCFFNVFFQMDNLEGLTMEKFAEKCGSHFN